MRTLGALIFIICFNFSFASVVSAQDDTGEFTIRVFAGSDTEAPTTPTLLYASAISETQVDLDWTDSTDNYTLSGYVVYRDGNPLATTTLSSYSDVGLTASTSYSYYVQAFDSFSNYSTTSNTVNITTPDYPAPAPPNEPTQGTVARVVVEEVVITPGISTTTFEITSTFPARFDIRWGRTATYELGYISSDILRRNYTTVITDLEPGTRYEYEIVGYTPYGSSNVVERGQFQTLDTLDLVAPANVKRFLALANGGDVKLSWQLPDDEDIANVRIVRSHLGYPANPSDGAIVYQGLGEQAVDRSVLFEYSPAYYTAFVYDKAGNISSGAVSKAYADWTDDTRTVITDIGAGSDIPIGSEELSTTSQQMPDAFDIKIKQNDKEFSFADEEIKLLHNEPFLLHLDVDNVTNNLKSIIVDLQDPTDQRQSFSFLLRLNKDQTAYEATIAPLRVVGKSAIVMNIYDFRSLRVAEYRSSLSFVDETRVLTLDENQENDYQLLWQFLSSIVVLLLLFLWWLLLKDRDEDKADATGL